MQATTVSLCSSVLLFSAVVQAQVLQGAPGELTFDSRVELQGFPSAIGDVNGDGFPDIVATNFGVNDRSQALVYFGNGTGNFTAGPTSSTNCELCSPGSGALADLNGDGKLDLIVVAGQLVFTMLGNGDGTFQPAVLYTGGGVTLGATGLAVGDLNGDGKPDFVVSDPGGWHTFLNNGDGTFSFSSYSLHNKQPDYYSDLKIGDLNGDSIPDLVYAGPFGVQSFLGDGTGKFKLKQTVAVGANPGSLARGDLNNDGKLDVVVRGTYLYRLFGNGDGTFGAPLRITEFYSAPGQIQIADFNGDGLADLAIAGISNFYIYYGIGGGLLTQPTPYDTGAMAGGLVVGNLRTGDKLDVVLSDFYGFSILFSKPNGFEDSVDVPVPLYPTAMAGADFNGDGLKDLVVTGGTEFQVLFGTGKASKPFIAGPHTPLVGGRSVTAADFNGDGKQDVVLSTYNDQNGVTAFYLCLGNGDGTFGAPVMILSNPNTGYAEMAAGDANGDGHPDLLITSVGYEFGNGEGVNVLFGKGDGTFQPPVSLGTPGSENIGLADFNNDGLPDIYAGDLTGDNAIVFLNQGNGKFAPATTWNVYGAGALTVCDINHDGNLDLVGNNGNGIAVLLGDGKGNFGNAIRTNDVLETVIAVACGSFTGTTYPEVVNLSEAWNLFTVMTNTGNGSLAVAQNAWGTGPAPVAMVVGKFHGASKLDDIVVLDSGLADITVLLNLTKPK